MNLPNKITVARIFLIPIFLIIMLAGFDWGTLHVGDTSLPVVDLVGAIIFIIASTTDWIDGYYARKLNMVTNLGKFLDPLADKLLVSAALIVLVDIELAPSWMVIVIISREFAVTGLRLLLAGEGEVSAAGQLGKIKTWAQIVAIAALLLHNVPFSLLSIPFGEIALWIAVIFTVISGWDYFVKGKHVFINSK
ncbi:CDP-diacylglycerol--glycerol-3-phosphate 3-phosphatidyltransferase [Priestia endophytica]|uniref:CDP-diacylglycerol--glycerol-3-phosphate 3-phosphatidyltransferase n=1 Tax=Priestia endophytica TaxID=135735 RepID=UPI000F538D40|nr:CDP-diacylglycerol--glycerol-3-phosphate 3-phosphatidyltransferase [Priestia endophytica]RPK15339.1 CDP-diacylglycerol--glycerol-3-phosphate 3-phosphatidyltransferase [Priestia endophytica]